MIKQHIITSEAWAQISDAGQNGTAWLEKVKGATDGRCRIWHGESAPDASKISHGFKMLYSEDNRDSIQLTADSALDVYYARSDNGNSTFVLNVDMV